MTFTEEWDEYILVSNVFRFDSNAIILTPREEEYSIVSILLRIYVDSKMIAFYQQREKGAVVCDDYVMIGSQLYFDS